MPNLTEKEIAALPRRFNLADGHAYRNWNVAEHGVVASASDLLRTVDRRLQKGYEDEYFHRFFSLAGQTPVPSRTSRFICTSASSAIEVVANHLRIEGMSVSLIEPCFDNLADILKRHRLEVHPLADGLLADHPDQLLERLERSPTDALFLVSPNNPTGQVVSRDHLRLVAEYCERTRTLLIVDACFRFYTPDELQYDQYALLSGYDLDWVLIEDTGKTFPSAEVKAPFFVASDGVSSALARIQSDFILHASPFAVRLLTEFVRVAQADQLSHVRGVVAQNRATLASALAGTGLHEIGRPYMSTAWLELPTGLPAGAAVHTLAAHDVHVLPGNQFFWSDHAAGSDRIRVALVRDSEMFTDAMQAFRRVGELKRART